MHHAIDRALALAEDPPVQLLAPEGLTRRRRERTLALAGEGRQPAPHVAHVLALDRDDPRNAAIALALETVARELEPLAATCFHVGADDEIASTVVHASHATPAEVVHEVRGWKAALHGADPLAPRELSSPPPRVATVCAGYSEALPLGPRAARALRSAGVAGDARLLIRDGDRIVAGVTLWRRLGAPPWSSAQLGRLRALQPLVEMAHQSAQAAAGTVDESRLPATLTRRERQVARVLARGVTNAQLAHLLHVSPNTAKTHARAVLAKLGVRSRRELVRRLADPRAGAVDPLRPARREPGDPPLWIDAATTREELLLAPFLGWGAARLGATVGGVASVTAHGSLVPRACGTARPSAHAQDRRLLHALQDALLGSAVFARLAADRAAPPVAALDACACDRERERIAALVARLGLGMPLVVVLRPLGRPAALAWLALDARADAEAGDAVRVLRAHQPLLESAYEPVVEGLRSVGPAVPALAGLPLTPRQLEVARHALDGAGTDEIAQTLRLTESTVKNHMTHVLAACGVRSRAQLVATYGGRAVARMS